MPPDDDEAQTENDDNQTLMTIFVVAGSLVAVVAIFFGARSLLANGNKERSSQENYREVSLFSKPLRKTKQKPKDQPGNMSMVQWVLEPPIIQLDPTLTEAQASRIEKDIKKRDGYFRSMVNSYLTQKNASFIWDKNRNDKLKKFLKKELDELYPNKVHRVLIPTFDAQY